jgi:hypothetical protein
VASVGPAPGQSRTQAGPVGVVDGPGQQVVQLGRNLARVGAVDVHRRRAQGGTSPPVQITGGPGPVDHLVIEGAGVGSPSGQPQGIGPVEELVDA